MDPTSLLISGGLSLAGSLFGGSGKDKGSPSTVSAVTMPQYSFTEPRMQLASDFISKNLQSMSEGKFPAYYQAAIPQIKSSMQRPLDQTYFGRAGERSTGLLNTSLNASASLGVGPAAGNAQVNKQMQRYADASTAIDEFIAKTGVDLTQQSMATMLSASNGMPMGPTSQLVQNGGQAPRQNQMPEIFSNMASSIPWLTQNNSSNVGWSPNGVMSNPAQSDWASNGVFGPSNGSGSMSFQGAPYQQSQSQYSSYISPFAGGMAGNLMTSLMKYL